MEKILDIELLEQAIARKDTSGDVLFDTLKWIKYMDVLDFVGTLSIENMAFYTVRMRSSILQYSTISGIEVFRGSAIHSSEMSKGKFSGVAVGCSMSESIRILGGILVECDYANAYIVVFGNCAIEF